MTNWFERTEEDIGKEKFADVLEPDEFGGGAMLLHDGRPDWVKHPTTGVQLKVTDHKKYKVTCPSCKAEDIVGTVTTVDNGGSDLHCLACPSCRQFVWFGSSL